MPEMRITYTGDLLGLKKVAEAAETSKLLGSLGVAMSVEFIEELHHAYVRVSDLTEFIESQSDVANETGLGTKLPLAIQRSVGLGRFDSRIDQQSALREENFVSFIHKDLLNPELYSAVDIPNIGPKSIEMLERFRQHRQNQSNPDQQS